MSLSQPSMYSNRAFVAGAAALIALSLATGVAHAQQPEPVRIGGEIQPPRKTKHVAPIYPKDALAAGDQGVVIMEATIGRDGKVTDAKVLRSIPSLDKAAADAVRQWEYEPTRLQGVAVAIVMTVTVNFKIEQPQSAGAPGVGPVTKPGPQQTGSPSAPKEVHPDYKEYGSLQETYDAGVRLQNAGKLPAAHIAFLRVLSHFDPNHAESWLRNAQVTHQGRLADPETVRSYLQKALARGTQSPHGPLSPAREAEARRLLAQLESGSATDQTDAGPQPSRSPSGPMPDSGTSQPVGSRCQETLAYLSSRLPIIDNAELANQRRIILDTRIAEVAANMTAQGIPLAQAASLILQQAEDHQRTLDGAKACAVESFGGNHAELASALDRRQYDVRLRAYPDGELTIRQMAAGPSDSNVFRSCLRAFIAADMVKLATDETAVQLTCLAARRR